MRKLHPTLLLGLSLISAGASALPAFKLARNYVAIRAVHPFQKHFRVYFQDVEPAVCTVAVADRDDVSALDKFPCGVGIFGVHNALQPVPPAQTELAAKVIERVKQLHPNGSEFEVVYDGDFRSIDITEFQPVSKGDAPEKTAATSLALGLRIDRQSGQLSLGVSNLDIPGRGFSNICNAVYPYPQSRTCDGEVKLVDYTNPPAIEGASILAGQFGKFAQSEPPYQREWETLSKKIVETADAIDAGTYVNPTTDVLKRQGDSLLPAQFHPYYDLKADGYGPEPRSPRSEGYQRLDQAALLAGEVPVRFELKPNGYLIEGTLNFPARKATLTLHTPTGQSSKPHDFVVDEKYLKIVNDGDRAFLGDFFSLKGNAPGQDYARNHICLDDQRTCVDINSLTSLAPVFPTH